MSNELTTTAIPTTNRRRKSWRNFTDEERAAYREERNAKRKAILDGIAKLTEEDRRKILKAMGTVGTCEGRNLSGVNTIMCFYQRGGKVCADGVNGCNYLRWANMPYEKKEGEG